jgi:ParB family chromosome partitioning protein
MAKQKNKGLGIGLDTLMPEDSKTELFSNKIKTSSDGAPLQINISDIDKNPYQPREKFNQEEILKLASSISEKGIIEPLIAIKKGDKYQLIAGHRRLMAAKHAKLDKVPIILYPNNAEPIDQLEIALVENMLRQNLNPIEEGKAFERLNKEFSKTIASIAEVVKKDRSTIENTIRLLRLPAEVKTEIDMGRLSAGHGKALLGLEAYQEQLIIIKNDILLNKLTVRQTEALVSKIVKNLKKDTEKIDKKVNNEEKDYYESLSKKISDVFGGLRVSILYKGLSKKIEINYNSIEDIEFIISKLNISIE